MRRAIVSLALLVTSCVQVEGFDPVGDVASVCGRWTIDSRTPSATSCQALGADRVRLTFLDGERPVTHSGLFFTCDEGRFTTVGSGGAVLGAGNWTVRLDAIDESGAVVATGPCQEVDVVAVPDAGGVLVNVVSANFLSSTISAAYRLGSQDPTQERCDTAGIATVSLVFEDLGGGTIASASSTCGTVPQVGCDAGADDAGASDAGVVATTALASEPCAARAVGVRAEPGHTYRVRVRALDAAGATVSESAARDVTVTAGMDIALDAEGSIDLAP